jgi:tRNA-Thr(GGU) m(6)t(6)A37 methyltransferase TsaA
MPIIKTGQKKQEALMNDVWQEPVVIRPIGVVVSDFTNFERAWTVHDESHIDVREDLTEGLRGLELFSHLTVIYHYHRREEWIQWRLGIPNGKEILTMPITGEPTCAGVYTSRSPVRRPGMGSCVVELLGREGKRLHVRGLDAVDGSPVLDIKIYIPRHDSFPLAETPLHWCQKTETLFTSRQFHWDTTSVSLTLGMRAGQRAMHELGTVRGEAGHAVVRGGNFFVQGVEAMTGCSMLHGTMRFEEKKGASIGAWLVVLHAARGSVEVRMKDRLYSGADEVLSLDDDHLFDVRRDNATVKE